MCLCASAGSHMELLSFLPGQACGRARTSRAARRGRRGAACSGSPRRPRWRPPPGAPRAAACSAGGRAGRGAWSECGGHEGCMGEVRRGRGVNEARIEWQVDRGRRLVGAVRAKRRRRHTWCVTAPGVMMTAPVTAPSYVSVTWPPMGTASAPGDGGQADARLGRASGMRTPCCSCMRGWRQLCHPGDAARAPVEVMTGRPGAKA